MLKRIIGTAWKYIVVAVITFAVILFYKGIERKPLLADDNTEFAKAVVTQVNNENLQAGLQMQSVTARRLLCV